MEGRAAELVTTALPTWRRLISLVATIGLLVGLFRDWRTIAAMYPAAAVLVVVGFALSLLLAILVLTVPADVLHRLDIGVLVLAIILFIGEHIGSFKPHHAGSTDEARLGHGALNALLAGHNPYAVTIPEHSGTHLITGGIVTHYAYPPLTLELGWLASKLSYRLGEPWIIAEIGVIATAIVAFLALPRAVRPLVIPVVFGLGVFDGYASNGFPMLVALPLLCVAAWNWTSIGRDGRLGWIGVGQAAALGLAAASQQLAWFVAAMFVLALWVVRCGELSRRRATIVVGLFALVAAVVFAAVNLPFAISNLHAWASGITTVFTQHAVPYGSGLVLLTLNVFHQCDDLNYFTYATVALACALLAITLVGLRRVAAAVPVLASVVFLLSARSDVEYFVAFIPLWLVWAGTTDADAIAASRPIGLPRRFRPVLTSTPRRVAAVALALLPAVLLAVDAVSGQGPLTMRADALISARTRPSELIVTITNHSSSTVTPSFYIGSPGHAHAWTAASGVLHLQPGQRRTVVLVPDGRPRPARESWRLTAFTSDPSTLSSTSLHVLPRPRSQTGGHVARRRPPHGPGHRHPVR